MAKPSNQISAVSPQRVMAPAQTGQEAMALVNPAYDAGQAQATSGFTGPATLRYLTPAEKTSAGLPLTGASGNQTEVFARVYPGGKFDILKVYNAISAEGKPVTFVGTYIPPSEVQPSSGNQVTVAAISGQFIRNNLPMSATLSVSDIAKGGYNLLGVNSITTTEGTLLTEGQLAPGAFSNMITQVNQSTAGYQASVKTAQSESGQISLIGGAFVGANGLGVSAILSPEQINQKGYLIQDISSVQLSTGVNVPASQISPEKMSSIISQVNFGSLLSNRPVIPYTEGGLEPTIIGLNNLTATQRADVLALAKSQQLSHESSLANRLFTDVEQFFLSSAAASTANQPERWKTGKYTSIEDFISAQGTYLGRNIALFPTSIVETGRMATMPIVSGLEYVSYKGDLYTVKFPSGYTSTPSQKSLIETEQFVTPTLSETFTPAGAIGWGASLVLSTIGLNMAGKVIGKAAQALSSPTSETAVFNRQIASIPLGEGKYSVLSVQVGPASTGDTEGAITSVTRSIVDTSKGAVLQTETAGQFTNFITGQKIYTPLQQAVSRQLIPPPKFIMDQQLEMSSAQVKDWLRTATASRFDPISGMYNIESVSVNIGPTEPSTLKSIPFAFGTPVDETRMLIDLNPFVTTLGRVDIPSTKAAGVFQTMQIQSDTSSIGGKMKVLKLGEYFTNDIASAVKELPWWPSTTTSYTITNIGPAIGSDTLGGHISTSIGQSLSQVFAHSLQSVVTVPVTSLSEVSIVGGALASVTKTKQVIEQAQTKTETQQITKAIQKPLLLELQKPIQETIQKPILLQVPVTGAIQIQKPVQLPIQEPMNIQIPVQLPVQLPIAIQQPIQIPVQLPIQSPVTITTITTLPIPPPPITLFGGLIPGRVRDVPLSGLLSGGVRIRKRRARAPSLIRYIRPDLISEWISYNRYGKATGPKVTPELLRQMGGHPGGYIPTLEMQLGKGGAEAQRLPKYANLFKGFSRFKFVNPLDLGGKKRKK